MQAREEGDGRPLVAVIWDFDWSFINENSDTYVVERLAPCLVPEMRELLKTEYKNNWTALMDHMIGRMMRDFGITLSQLNECLCSIPIFKENIEALQLACSMEALNFILSDANHHYISIILNHHNLHSMFTDVETNNCNLERFSSDSALLRVFPHQLDSDPHHCMLCPRNLCKGNVLDRWRNKYMFNKVIYVGDGGGDFCPALRLDTTDVLLCRQGFPLQKKCADAKSSQNIEVRAKVREWSNGKDILSCFQELLH